MVSCAALRHGVAGVDREVHDDLLDLAGSALTLPSPRPGAVHEVDVLADEPPEHRLDVADDRVQVEDLRREHLLAAEGEQLARQVRPRARRPRWI